MEPQGSQNVGDGALEDRIRGLILSNATAPSPNQTSPPGLPIPGPAPPLPPHLLKASPEQKEAYFRAAAARAAVNAERAAANAQNTVRVAEPQQGTHKRMNQAQRRQMSSQLSIPFDSRQPYQTGPSPYGFSPASGFPTNNNFAQMQNRPFPNQRQFQNPPRYGNVPSPSHYSPQLNHMDSARSPPYSNQASPQYRFTKQGTSPQVPQLQSPNQANNPAGSFVSRPAPQNRQLYNPNQAGGHGGMRQFGASPEELAAETRYLETLVQEYVPLAGIDKDEVLAKEAFRARIEQICREAIVEYEQQELGTENFDSSTVQLKCYGSLSSGFATKGSDMDLALLTPLSKPPAESSESRIPRLLEKKLLDLGYGARLLTKTRVPIIKLCEKPTVKLMSDLLEERAKWENGFNEEQAEGAEEEKHGNGSPKTDEKSKVSPKDIAEKPKSGSTSARASPEVAVEVPKSANSRDEGKASPSLSNDLNPNEIKKFILQQKEKQSLSEYYNCAKRHLRKLGGRDLSINSTELTPEEMAILKEVCKAFISGLASEELSARLKAYRSISPLFDESVPGLKRSLNGIWTQVEGENLAMAWDTRVIQEPTERRETEGKNYLDAWKAAQDKDVSSTESQIYNRHLYTSLERLKKIDSLQLQSFEQFPFEEPRSYFTRVNIVRKDLKGFNLPLSSLLPRKESNDEINALFVRQYVAGILHPKIREKLEPLQDKTTLEDIAQKHQILQLALDYEHALNIHYFEDGDKADVERYLSSLYDLVTGEPFDDLGYKALVRRIRALPDPTQVSLNKPRDRYRDHLEFPKNTVGIQCDINFSNLLALHNTLLLRLYSLCDPRVKTMVLFIKHWAKVRGINTPYRGTLGSYGYVLMVLHFIINVVQPPVVPNLQHFNPTPPPHLSSAQRVAQTICCGRDVKFWRDEDEIRRMAAAGTMTQNHQSVGFLLRGFFEYFAQNGPMSSQPARGFDWGREVLSLRTVGGILSKQEKDWVGARTVVQTKQFAAPPTPNTPSFPNTAPTSPDPTPASSVSSPEAALATLSTSPSATTPRLVSSTTEIRHRYLFAIEDPFETDHNIARTVTHNGIVSIRDEFRRAWGILRSVGKHGGFVEGRMGPGGKRVEGLLESVEAPGEGKQGFLGLLDQIHGKVDQD